jgi:hypothetical protein
VSNIFDLTAARFSRETALSLAQFSELAYRDTDEICGVLNEGGLHVKWFEDEATDTQAFVAWDDSITVICFRGTENIQSAITDIEVKLLVYDYGAGEVHGGFIGSWNAVYTDIAQHIEQNCPAKELLVTGHSLGGALAVIAADHFVYEGRMVRAYTFGQPRVFDQRGVEQAAERLDGYHRFVHNNDVVPRIPFAGWGYRHAGRLNHFDHTGKLLLDPAAWMVFADRVIGRFKSRKLNPFKWTSDGLDDHSMTRYVDLVNTWASQ